MNLFCLWGLLQIGNVTKLLIHDELTFTSSLQLRPLEVAHR